MSSYRSTGNELDCQGLVTFDVKVSMVPKACIVQSCFICPRRPYVFWLLSVSDGVLFVIFQIFLLRDTKVFVILVKLYLYRFR